MKRLTLGVLKGLVRHVWLIVPLAVPIVIGGCATTRRATQLVVDHHVGMARGAIDIMSGKAEEREQRVAKLRADLEASRSALAAEQDQGRLIELLRQHVVLQDALVAELLQAHGHHHGGGHQHAQAETKQGQSESHQH